MEYVVNEHDELTVTVSFYNESQVLSAPTSISYRVDTAGGTQLRDDTSVSAASSVSITLKYADNAISDSNLTEEEHVMTVTAGFGTDGDGNPRQITREFRYLVKNLSAIS